LFTTDEFIEPKLSGLITYLLTLIYILLLIYKIFNTLIEKGF